MWTIDYTDNGTDIRVSYDNEEIHTDSPGLETLILQGILNPPVLYATPVGPAEIFNLSVSYLAYYLVANILVNKLDIRNWQATGDYLWPLDHETTGSNTVFSSYVDYLRNKTVTAAGNPCHDPHSGKFCEREGSIQPSKENPTGKGQPGVSQVKRTSGSLNKLNKELTEQGFPEDSPLRGVILHGGDYTLVNRDSQGKINGAYTIGYDKTGGVTLLDFRAVPERQGTGTALITAAAKLALTTRDKTMTHHGSLGTAVPFYQKNGAEYKIEEARSIVTGEKVGTGEHFDTYGISDAKATRALAEGHPIDKRTPDPNITQLDHDQYGNVVGYNHTGWKEYSQDGGKTPNRKGDPYVPVEEQERLLKEARKRGELSNKYVEYLRDNRKREVEDE